jgi:hypothetical protein
MPVSGSVGPGAGVGGATGVAELDGVVGFFVGLGVGFFEGFVVAGVELEFDTGVTGVVCDGGIDGAPVGVAVEMPPDCSGPVGEAGTPT